MGLDQDTWNTIAGYGKFFITLFIFVIFYSYAYSIYKRDKTGERDFEKYSSLVHDDSIESKPLENRKDKEDDKKEKVV